MEFKVESVSKVVSGDFKGHKEVLMVGEDGRSRYHALVNQKGKVIHIKSTNNYGYSQKTAKKIRKAIHSKGYRWEELYAPGKKIESLEVFHYIEFRHGLIKGKEPIVCVKEEVKNDEQGNFYFTLYIMPEDHKICKITKFFKERKYTYHKLCEQEDFPERLINEGYNIIQIVSSKEEMEEVLKNRS
ncbi:hypothetical protein [Bacillus cereus]|uniref:hypothetical protein n=1 Tax=Bacillus cereus TaxID=1396 RepID=UPI000BEE55BC|nr:hypothetical protein [Bacillus cereus]PDY82773.1 hypothetical protein CON06_10235 [Bacillus cereus]